jgi:hypothetical protein
MRPVLAQSGISLRRINSVAIGSKRTSRGHSLPLPGVLHCAAPWRRMILDPRLGAHVLFFELSDERSETRRER